MDKASGKIQSWGTRSITSKAGKRFNVHSLFLEGDPNEYELGFKKPELDIGAEVNFMWEIKFGKRAVDPATLTRGAGPSGTYTASATAPLGGAPPEPKPPYQGGGAAGKPFPVPKTSGERAIIRQNALTNARELVVSTQPVVNTDELVSEIIRVARRFEAYSTGDLEMDEVEKVVKAKSKKAEAASEESDKGPF